MKAGLECPDQEEVIRLIADLDAYQDSLYPPECRYALDLDSLKQDNVRFVVARDDGDVAVGCGAIVLYEDYGELKRLYVAPAYRSNGVARRILAQLESSAQEAGRLVFKLETGPFQPEALAFYARNGYQRCGPYGDYRDDPMSVFMSKQSLPT